MNDIHWAYVFAIVYSVLCSVCVKVVEVLTRERDDDKDGDDQDSAKVVPDGDGDHNNNYEMSNVDNYYDYVGYTMRDDVAEVATNTYGHYVDTQDTAVLYGSYSSINENEDDLVTVNDTVKVIDSGRDYDAKVVGDVSRLDEVDRCVLRNTIHSAHRIEQYESSNTVLKYEYENDKNGLFYHLGFSGEEWQNPVAHSNNRLKVTSSNDKLDVTMIADRNPLAMRKKAPEHMTVELVDSEMELRGIFFCVRFATSLSCSNDGETWTHLGYFYYPYNKGYQKVLSNTVKTRCRYFRFNTFGELGSVELYGVLCPLAKSNSTVNERPSVVPENSPADVNRSADQMRATSLEHILDMARVCKNSGKDLVLFFYEDHDRLAVEYTNEPSSSFSAVVSNLTNADSRYGGYGMGNSQAAIELGFHDMVVPSAMYEALVYFNVHTFPTTMVLKRGEFDSTSIVVVGHQFFRLSDQFLRGRSHLFLSISQEILRMLKLHAPILMTDEFFRSEFHVLNRYSCEYYALNCILAPMMIPLVAVCFFMMYPFVLIWVGVAPSMTILWTQNDEWSERWYFVEVAKAILAVAKRSHWSLWPVTFPVVSTVLLVCSFFMYFLVLYRRVTRHNQPRMATSISGEYIYTVKALRNVEREWSLYTNFDATVMDRARALQQMKLRNWTDVFVGALSSRKVDVLKNVGNAFSLYAENVAKILIKERVRPLSERTFKPIGGAGFAGGEKYFHEQCSCFFKFAYDDKGLYQGDDEAAIKSALNELRAMNACVPLLKSVMVPMMVVCRSKGHCVVAVAALPISADTLVYGSADGGATVKNESPEANSEMQLVAAHFHLKEHIIGSSNVKLVTAGDVEIHKVRSQLWMIDLGRFFPPTNSDAPQIFYQHWRPEAMRMQSAPLCVDAFTRWAKHNSEEHNTGVERAREQVIRDVVPRVARLIERNVKVRSWYFSGAISQVMHRNGLNIRDLGHVYSHIDDTKTDIRIALVRLMLVRILKSRWRRTERRLWCSDDRVYGLAMIHLLAFVMLDNSEADYFWREVVPKDLQRKFSASISSDELQVVRENIAENSVEFLNSVPNVVVPGHARSWSREKLCELFEYRDGITLPEAWIFDDTKVVASKLLPTSLTQSYEALFLSGTSRFLPLGVLCVLAGVLSYVALAKIEDDAGILELHHTGRYVVNAVVPFCVCMVLMIVGNVAGETFNPLGGATASHPFQLMLGFNFLLIVLANIASGDFLGSLINVGSATTYFGFLYFVSTQYSAY